MRTSGKIFKCALIFICFSLCVSIFVSGVTVQSEKKDNTQKAGNMATVKLYNTAFEYINSMEIAAQDSKAVLYYDADTANIAVYNKADNTYWFSAPVINSGFNTLTASQQKLLLSPVTLTYIDSKMMKYTLNSFADCAEYGGVSSEKTENGVTFSMILGKTSSSSNVPKCIPQSRMEWIEKNSDNSVYKFIKQSYRKVKGIDNGGKEADLSDYPGLSNGDVYVIRANTNDAVLKKLSDMFIKSRYTDDMMLEDEIAVYGKKKSTQQSRATFSVKLQYTLENGQLVVNMPAAEIKYDEKEYRLADVEILKYFGAADIKNNGFFLLPDGSGAVSEYKSGVTENGVRYYSELYGNDTAYRYDSSKENLKNAVIPMFSQVKENSGYIAIAEEGESQMAVQSVVDDAENLMRYASFCSHLRLSEQYIHTENASRDAYYKSTVHQYDKNVKIRYIFFEGNDYGKIAEIYRNYLIDNKKLVLSKEKPDGVSLEVLGALNVNENNFLSDTKLYPLTAYSDTQKIIKEFCGYGIPFGIEYNGWANGGIDYTAFNKAKPVSVLGSKKQLSALIKYAKKNSVPLSFETDFSYIQKDKLFDGFSATMDATHRLDNSYGCTYRYNIATNSGNYSEKIYSVKSNAMLKYAESFSENDKFCFDGLLIKGIGETVNSDSSKKSGSREDAKKDYVKLINNLSGKYRLSFDGGNQYVWNKASSIRNLPCDSSLYRNTDYSVPFVQMLLHGSIPYSSERINLSGDTTLSLLKAIENGERLSYTVAYKNVNKIAKSRHTEYNSVDYGYWREIIKQQYEKWHSVLDGTFDKVITNHCVLQENVVKTVYENGTEIIVNYSCKPFSYKGKTVQPQDVAAFKQ